MQVATQLVAAVASQLKARVIAAFPDRACSDWEAMLLPAYRPHDEATQMAIEFAGHAWRALARYRLFYHGDVMFALTAEAFQVYLPAYLCACLEPSDRYTADFFEHILFRLSPRNEPAMVERTRLLDDTQRKVTTDVLGYIALWSGGSEAWRALEWWRGSKESSCK